MKVSQKHIQPITSTIIMVILLFMTSMKSNGVKVLSSDTANDECYNLYKMNCFIQAHYPEVEINIEQKILNSYLNDGFDNDFATYFRFMSILSGLYTPYNDDMIFLNIYSDSILHNDENVKLIKWYSRNHEKIDCDVFNQYYNLEKAMRKGPQRQIDDFDKYLAYMEAYNDSLECGIEEFKTKYFRYLATDSIQ